MNNRLAQSIFTGESNTVFNEREVRTINYETQPSKPLIRKLGNSKENVELSLEVEIAASLKKLLESAKQCESRLLDVTIIRPNETDPSNKVETNTVPFRKSEIKDLISIIEKQKHEKKIDHPKRNFFDKINSQDNNFRSQSPPEGYRRSAALKNARKSRRNDNIKFDIRTESAPPNFSKEKGKLNFDAKCGEGSHLKTESNYPYHKKLRKKLEEKLFGSKTRFSSSPDDSSYSGECSLTKFQRTASTNQMEAQVYATPRDPLGDLRKKLKCTNPHKNDKPEEPCICQNCGMVGVLLDSAKGPVLPAQTLSNTPWSSDRITRPPPRKFDEKRAGKRHKSHPHDNILKQLHIRIKSLEERVTIQEESSVSREYFKSIINRLLSTYKSTFGGAEAAAKCETSTQCTTNYGKKANNMPFYKKNIPGGDKGSFKVRCLIVF